MPKTISIIESSVDLIAIWSRLMKELWPESNVDALKQEARNIIKSPNQTAFILSIDNRYVGFINVSIRSDYVPGAIHSPVGYIEGIYIKSRYRHRGLARKLVEHATGWFVANGCKEIGSDTEIENISSQNWHQTMGFTKKSTLVHYINEIH